MLITWHDGMSVGVDLIDEEHKKLIGFLNELHEAILQKKGRDVLASTLLAVMSYTTYHFGHEEEIFCASAFPDKEAHIAQHQALTSKLLDIHRKHSLGISEEISIELMIFLKEWIIDHIQGTDVKYIPYIKQDRQHEVVSGA